jgi:hypothetical protein
MLSVEECRKYLDDETNQPLSDEEVLQLRDEMVAFANLAFDIYDSKKKRGEL